MDQIISQNSKNEGITSLNDKIIINNSNEKKQFDNIKDFYDSNLNVEHQNCNNSNFGQNSNYYIYSNNSNYKTDLSSVNSFFE